MIGFWVYLAGALVWIAYGAYWARSEPEEKQSDLLGVIVIISAVWPIAVAITIGWSVGRPPKTPQAERD